MSFRSVAIRSVVASAFLASAACQSAPAAVNPQDPEITAAIEAAINTALAGAEAADAERSLSVTTRDENFTFITGDTMLVGYDRALEESRVTYAMLASQKHDVIQRRIRVLAPDVALVTSVSEGTYTDKAGFTSPPVGLGSTAVFVKRNGEWRAIHYHQSVAK